jgi:coenzyme F420-reducing hydrogenase alpha subunit
MREYGMDIVRIIGGRVVHPLTNEVGGFKKVPNRKDIKELLDKSEKAIDIFLELGEFFSKFKIPEFERETEYVSLDNGRDYSIYEGDVKSNKGLHIKVEDFENNFNELQRPREIVKRVESDGKTSYMVGAIARINNNRKKLNPKAEEFFDSLGYKLPDYNPFHNIIYQMVEVIHATEESIKILKLLEESQLENALTKEYKVKEGTAVAGIEAPRGTLYYHTDIDENGYIKNVNIITPTAQTLSHLEDDIKAFLPDVMDLPEKKRTQKLRSFIRAYDPCISCAVH